MEKEMEKEIKKALEQMKREEAIESFRIALSEVETPDNEAKEKEKEYF